MQYWEDATILLTFVTGFYTSHFLGIPEDIVVNCFLFLMDEKRAGTQDAPIKTVVIYYLKIEKMYAHL